MSETKNKRHIEPSKIQGVQAKFNPAFLNFSHPTVAVEDESKASLENCFNNFKATSEEIVFMVSNFNDYLDTVAEAFKNADANLATQIKEIKIEPHDYRYVRNKQKEIARQNIYYDNI